MEKDHIMACAASAGLRTARHDRFLEVIQTKLPKELRAMRVNATNNNLFPNSPLLPDIRFRSKI